MLAESIIATTHGSGSSEGSGKRSAKDVKSTPSTRVTPEAKVPCVAPDVVEPRSLEFEETEPADTPGSVCVCVCGPCDIHIYIYVAVCWLSFPTWLFLSIKRTKPNLTDVSKKVVPQNRYGKLFKIHGVCIHYVWKHYTYNIYIYMCIPRHGCWHSPTLAHVGAWRGRGQVISLANWYRYSLVPFFLVIPVRKERSYGGAGSRSRVTGGALTRSHSSSCNYTYITSPKQPQAARPVSSSTVPVPKPQPAAPKQTLANSRRQRSNSSLWPEMAWQLFLPPCAVLVLVNCL